MDIGELAAAVPSQTARLNEARQAIGDHIAWYPYDCLGSIGAINTLLHDENRDLSRLAGGLRVADIGGADGDLSFVLEDAGGFAVDFIDTAGPNMNRMAGVHALGAHLGSQVAIHDIDLDTQFQLPTERYGLVFLLGILYHLQNPYYVLRQLSARTRYLILSTRVARFGGPDRTPIAELPVAYLVGPEETNNDSSNYWIFSPGGLGRIVDRTGWTVLERTSIGDVTDSDPASPEHDERAFMLLHSKLAGPPPEAQSGALERRRLRIRGRRRLRVPERRPRR